MESNFFNKYMVEGVINSGIKEDGGLECYSQIPKLEHIGASIFWTLFYGYLIAKWNNSLIVSEKQTQKQIKYPSTIQKIIAWVGIASLIITFYFKIIYKKGLFILNPCHVTLVMLIILLLSPSTIFMRKMYTSMSAWLFGAMLALMFPHLEGVSVQQIYLYYLQHFLIYPIAPLLLYKRYGFVIPSFKDQMCSFGTVAVYQIVVLASFGVTTMVNLNFALCHSHADPFYPFLGYHYFALAPAYLNFNSFLCRWIHYATILPMKIYYNFQKQKKKICDIRQNTKSTNNIVDS